ncbi:hypothetical protein QVN85_01680 [Oscillibacter valericigenes]|nr:hypothetical protein [Oscillibacter valericigenes]
MNQKDCYLVDENGIFKDNVLANFDDEDKPISYEVTFGSTPIPESYNAIPVTSTENNPRAFVKGKWDGTKFVESATAEEIAAWEAAHPGKVLTLAEVQAAKLAEINAACTAAIEAGCDVTLSDSTVGHISLSIPDQINLSTAQEAIKAGGTGYAYHLDGALCEIYTAADIAIMAKAATAHVLYHQTYCNHVRAWVKRCTAIADVESITYGAVLPDDLKAHMATVLGGGNA